MNKESNFDMETARLLLRPMISEDASAMLKVFQTFTIPQFTADQMERWIGRNLEHQTKYGYGLFSVILKSENLLIGDCGLEHMEVNGVSIVELGYDFSSACWNQGYATEAATAVCDCAIHTLGLPGLASLIQVGNLASRRVAEKVGMRLVSEVVRHDRPYWIFGIGDLPIFQPPA